MRAFKLLVFLIIYLAFYEVEAGADVGDDCDVESLSSSGQCTLLKHCPDAMEEVYNGKQPPLCGFRGKEPIVCCFGEILTIEKSSIIEDISTILQTPNLDLEKEQISRKKCDEYSLRIMNLTSDYVPSLNGKPVLINSNFCSNFLIVPIIQTVTEYPHMALIGADENNRTEWGCTGTLISEQFVLTTATCTQSRRDVNITKVRLGEIKVDSAPKPEDYQIIEIILHPEYSSPEVYNDIALIKLHKQVEFTERVYPACLPYEQENNTRFIMAGWNLFFDNEYVDVKGVNRMSNENCAKAFETIKSRYLTRGIDEDTQLCIGTLEQQSCSFLSGSPLTIYSNVTCMYDIMGLSTFSNSTCGLQPVVHAYTRVSKYVNWIQNIVWT